MQKLPPIMVDGKGNLSQMIYGYSKKVEQVLDKIEQKFLKYIHQEFAQGGPIDSWSHWPKLHPMTIQFKAGGGLSTEILKETGNLEESFITVRTKTFIWLGSEDPKAIVHEFGMFIKVTPGMRRVFAARGFPLKKSTTWITIPSRRMFRPVMKKLKDEFPVLMKGKMSELDFTPIKITPMKG